MCIVYPLVLTLLVGQLKECPTCSVILVMIFQLQLSYSFDFLVTVIILVNYKGIF